MQAFILAVTAVLSITSAAVGAQPLAPVGGIKEDAWVHTPESLAATVQQADVCLPPATAGFLALLGKAKT